MEESKQHPARILVVDDEPRSVQLLARSLRGVGEVETAASGEEAWEKLQQGDFHPCGFAPAQAQPIAAQLIDGGIPERGASHCADRGLWHQAEVRQPAADRILRVDGYDHAVAAQC